MKKIYFDHAATSYIYDEVIELMSDLMKKCMGNPSSTHSYGQEAKAIIENTRKQIAKNINAEPSEIVFTSGGTEANNLIIRSSVEHLGVQRIITTPMEHKCVLETTLAMKKNNEVEVKMLSIDKHGDIAIQELENLLKEDTPTLVTLMHANNEVGNFYPIQKIAELIDGMDHVYFHSDTIQTIGHYPLDFKEIPLDFASASAHKFHGPKGVGFAYIRNKSKLKPQIYGGGQERNTRSGTENVYGIAGMGKALQISIDRMQADKEYISDIKEYAISQLQENIEGVEFNGYSADNDKSLYTVLNLWIPTNNSMLGFQLDMNGIALSQGSACSSGAAKVSLVMSRLRTDEELKNGSPFRLSFSPKNTKEEINYLVKTLKNLLESSPISSK